MAKKQDIKNKRNQRDNFSSTTRAGKRLSEEFTAGLKNIKTWILAFLYVSGYFFLRSVVTPRRGKPIDWDSVVPERFHTLFWIGFILNLAYILYATTYYLVYMADYGDEFKEIMIKTAFLFMLLIVVLLIMPFVLAFT